MAIKPAPMFERLAGNDSSHARYVRAVVPA